MKCREKSKSFAVSEGLVAVRVVWMFFVCLDGCFWMVCRQLPVVEVGEVIIVCI